MSQHSLIAACAFGLEALVKRELLALGCEPHVTGPGRIEFSGDEDAIARSNLRLRTADRIWLRVGETPAHDWDALFEGVKSLPWEAFIPAAGLFPVTAVSHKSALTSIPALQRSVKKAIVERLLDKHKANSLPESGCRCAVRVELHQDLAALLLDATGASLHKRGYRTYVGAAPLKETLAAALVMLSPWTFERPLLDPFCGSGVICLEAALIGRDVAPGLGRTFDAEHWPWLAKSIWNDARQEALDLEKRNRPLKIMGVDSDPHVLHLAGRNRKEAGIGGGVTFREGDAIAAIGDCNLGDYGCLITNPPYGMRLGERAEIEQLYGKLPLAFRDLPTWSFFLLSQHQDFERLVGQTASRRRKLYNGRIACTFYQYLGPKPPHLLKNNDRASVKPASVENVVGDATENFAAAEKFQHKPKATATPTQEPPAAEKPLFGGVPSADLAVIDDFRRRLAKRAKHLRKWPTKRGITCYRLYDRDVPGVPLVIDVFEDHLHIAEYERPHERTVAEHADWLDAAVAAASEVLDTPGERIHVKTRRKQKGADQYGRIDDARKEVVVQEGGLKFLVNFDDYLDVGLFLDHRPLREMVRRDATGRRVLNLFCYTGAITAFAAAGGACSTVSVDLSRNYLDWAKRNLELNEQSDGEHEFVQADCLTYLASLTRRPLYDLIVIDPPTFSNSKQTEQDWNVQHHAAEIVHEAAGRLSPTGLLYFSTNFRRFKPPWEETPEWTAHEISRQTVPEDFRNRRIHRCWKMRLRENQT